MLISVIIPTYNRAQLLPRAIKSVLNQTYSDWELIVVDDGSEDETAMVVSQFDDSRIRYIRKENTGAADSRNVGVSHSKGEVITFLDSDDEAFPDWLEEANQAFQATEIKLFFCGVKNLGINGHFSVELPKYGGPFYKHQTVRFNGGSFFVRRKIFEEIAGYDPELRAGQHTELGLRIMHQHDLVRSNLAFVDKPLILVHKAGNNRIRNDHEAIYQGILYFLTKHQDLMGTMPRIRHTYLSNAAYRAHLLGKRKEAIQLMWEAIQTMPWHWKNTPRLIRYALS